MATMTPSTRDDIENFKRLVQHAPFGAGLALNIAPYATDPIPPLNLRGGRNAEGWRAVYEGVVQPEWGNPMGAMHGAAVAWVVDTCTSAAIVALHTPEFWGPPMTGGVSLTLDTSFFNAAPVGTKIRILVTMERLSPTLANLRCDITEWDTGRRLSSGTHCKTWRPAPSKDKAKA
ncbi:uncharacterized protein EHS24_001084 [Apiotrichum porosum]|uniref:Thioesterase domain-containing protein n=1 Tax=Apiotrichum porosum TaxID=105984 RepID=A0A427YBK0_9TREE|nr:uncharacterized protein EHS24_001084 [Apiotrichum porosum]RSH88539.1 hypothetical protein EHS24_001084 [Apiotrichum porosum]